MEWLTEKEVAAAAKKSKRAAIACSKKHWKQNYTATEEEIDEYCDNYRIVNADSCALCVRYTIIDEEGDVEDTDCAACPLGPNRCCDEYYAAADAFDKWYYYNGSFADWQAKAKLMYDRLCKI